MKKFVIYGIIASMLLASCSKSELGVIMPEDVHPEGCTPIDIELFSAVQTRSTVSNDNIDSYYLLIDQADENDTGLAITGTRFDYVVKVKRAYIPIAGEAADQYKRLDLGGTWEKWEVYDMTIDGTGKVVEGAKRTSPMYIYNLDEKYYYDRYNDNLLREKYESDHAYYEWEHENWLLNPSQPEPTPPTPPTYATDPSKNTTPNLKYWAIKWDAKDGELFKVKDNRIILNDADINIDLSSMNPYDLYHNDLLFTEGDKEHITLDASFKMPIYPEHQFTRVNIEFDFIGNFKEIYYSKSNYALTNTKDAANHESVIYSIDIKSTSGNPMEYLTGFNFTTGTAIKREASIGDGVINADLKLDYEHKFPVSLEDENYSADLQLLVSPYQFTADGLAGDYNLSFKITTKKYVVNGTKYTMDETKRDREFSHTTKNITQESFGSGKSLQFRFDIGDNYDYN